MENIAILIKYLRDNNWHMTSFLFNYKQIEYIVLFEDLNNLTINNNGYDVLLTFIDSDDETRKLSVMANSYRFEFEVKEFREFFHIEFSHNLGNVFKQFYEYFNDFVPVTTNIHHTDQEKRLTIERLNRNDNDNNICCYKLMRNPTVNGKQHHRTMFNAQKCRMLKNDLYIHFERDDTISFCFREENELTTNEILRNFAKHEYRRQHG